MNECGRICRRGVLPPTKLGKPRAAVQEVNGDAELAVDALTRSRAGGGGGPTCLSMTTAGVWFAIVLMGASRSETWLLYVPVSGRIIEGVVSLAALSSSSSLSSSCPSWKQELAAVLACHMTATLIVT